MIYFSQLHCFRLTVEVPAAEYDAAARLWQRLRPELTLYADRRAKRECALPTFAAVQAVRTGCLFSINVVSSFNMIYCDG